MGTEREHVVGEARTRRGPSPIGLIEIASAVARAEVSALGAELERSLRQVGLALEADIVSIAVAEDGGLTTLYQWRAVGWMDPAFAIDTGRAGWWRQRQARAKEILIDDVSAMPRAARYERDLLLNRGTRALAAIPCASIDGLRGYIIAEHQRKRHAWTDEELTYLETYAEIVTSSIERDQTQSELVDATRRAEQANRAKTDFIASMSHELKTPLTAILGFADLLGRELAGPINEQQRRYIADIRDSAEHLREIVDDTLDIARIDADRIELSPSEVPLALIVDSAATQVRDTAARASLALEVSLPAPDLTVWADGRKLRQIAINLLANAVKFTPSGGCVRIAAALDGDSYRIEVRDTGIGIAPRDHERIFDTFTRLADARATRPAEGCGLGLSLARRLARAHGGDITVRSELGAGAAFSVRLPRDARPMVRRASY